jgi:hypothetical protein
MLRAESFVERPRRACPVLAAWAGSFTLKIPSYSITSEIVFLRIYVKVRIESALL